MGPTIRREVVVSLVIPIFNEEEVLDALHSAVTNVLDDIGDSWEIVYVNDGSRDRSLDKLLAYQAADPRVTVVELSRNWGHQSALTAGLQVARGQAVVMMDGDFQDPPEVIADFVEAWHRGAQIVVAQRRTRRETGFRRIVYPVFYKLMGFLSDYPIPLNAGIFGLLDRQVVDAINSLTENNRYLPGLRAWVGYKTEVLFYDRQDRAAGAPKQTFWRLLKYGLDAIFSFSYKPLRLSLVLGFITACFAMFYGLALAIARTAGWQLFGPIVWGYTSTIVSVLFMGGIQLVCLGILGEYIGRIYDEVKRRPLYLVRNIHEGTETVGIMDEQGDKVPTIVKGRIAA
ncbi:MAG TPA: glycosyltransferase family 2 protein [Terriglobales bacterium]|jgi:dolichol-phosphate mannosyltransferase|nr:glycosyltransferase family 2 protein [Terriglobales bacterium]